MSQNEIDTLIDDCIAFMHSLLPEKKEGTAIDLPPPPKEKPKEKKVEPPPPPPSIEKPPPKKIDTKEFISLDPPSAPKGTGTVAIKKVLSEVAPDIYLHETIPSDYLAKRIKNAWREKRGTPDIPILFQGQKYRPFIANLAKAIDLQVGSCRIVEIEPKKKWDLFLESENLRFIIIPDVLLFGNKDLLPYYQENPQQKTRKLGNIPLLLLPDLSLYFKDPYLKRALWNVIKDFLA